MHRIHFSHHSPFLSLPQDLKSLIFEFLPLSNYLKLQLVCRNFYYVLMTNPELWAKHLYALFLDPLLNQDLVFGEDFCEERQPINKDKIRFESMATSRKILGTYYGLREEYERFFKTFLPPAISQELTKEVFACLRNPSYPTPCLKKDIHFFPTKTMFQNFLTEIHFSLQGRTFMKDRKQFLIETVIENIKASLSKGSIDANKLLSLRWYLFDKEDPVIRNKNFSNSKFPFGKRISKMKSILRNGKIHTFMDRLGGEELKSFKKEHKVRTHFMNGKSTDIVHKNSRMEIEGENNESDALEFNSDDWDNGPNLMEKFYKLIHKLIRNHAQMIFIYLRTINDSQLLLNEYIRFWAEFVLITIDLNKVFIPFSELFNEVYNHHCQGYPNFPEFSIWRVLIKIWVNEVYTPLENTLQQSFLSILMDLRVRNCPPQINLFQFERSLLYTKLYKQGPNLFSNPSIFSNVDESNMFDQEKEKVETLLKQFYQVVCDLSYDEFNIFYSDCIPTGNETPKGLLDAVIINNTKKLYEGCKDILVQESNHIVNFLKGDIEAIEGLFGEELGCKLRDCQIEIFKEFLVNSFFAAMEQYDNSVHIPVMVSSNIFSTNNFGVSQPNISLGHMIALLQIPEDTCQKICENQSHREGFTKTLIKICPVFNLFLNFLGGLKERQEYQFREFEEACNERYRRGFTLIDEKYDNFFAFRKNPTSLCIQNMKEKLSDLQSLNNKIIEEKA